jgi:hypothetical protein
VIGIGEKMLELSVVELVEIYLPVLERAPDYQGGPSRA